MPKLAILLIFLFCCLKIYAFGLDLYSSPDLISAAEICLLSSSPVGAYYQPAIRNEGISFSHSNPYGFTELNVMHLAAQFTILGEILALGSFALENKYISDKVFYLGYQKNILGLTWGVNTRLYSQAIEGYDTLNSSTINVGFVWENKIITHGVSYSNVFFTKKEELELPSVFKYECLISPLEKTAFAVSFEKEADFAMRYAFAVSQKITKILSVTTGFLTNPSQFSAGAGIIINHLEVNYGMRTHAELSYTQGVGVKYNF
jgi:hypothetical protein